MGSTHSQMSNASDRMEVSRARLNPVARSSGPVSYGFASLENSVMLDTETICSVGSQSDDSGPPSLQNELDNLAGTMERGAATDPLQQQNQATSPQSLDLSPVVPNVPANGRWKPFGKPILLTCNSTNFPKIFYFLLCFCVNLTKPHIMNKPKK